MLSMIENATRIVGLLIAASALFAASTAPSTLAQSDEDGLTIAVAANFTRPMEQLADRFGAETDRATTLVDGSTGALFTQISNGAPFDVFFAADVERPRRLQDEGRIVEGSRFTYAIGQPVLWSPADDVVDPSGNVLETGNFRRIALADPELAPYGEAARQVMIARGVWDELQSQHKVVFGRNVNQAHQFVRSGNAELGFVALSQVIAPDSGKIKGSHWRPPQSQHDPVEQQAVILKRTDQRALAQSFVEFVRSEAGAEVMEPFGYAVPEAGDASSD
ncbi:MAG: molybdate ABC transporter substrate-binding protein [Candidatus Bipolaricaulia bacterium]